MESYAPYYWLAIAVVMSILEASTAQMVSIWFVIAAVVSLVLSLFAVPVVVQVLSFAVVSLLLLVLTRPVMKRFMNIKKTETNSDRYIGSRGVVIQEIDNLKGTGQVNVSGSVWTARSIDGQRIEKDSFVKVESIEGVKFIVTKCENKEES